jgi:hypothetical protein
MLKSQSRQLSRNPATQTMQRPHARSLSRSFSLGLSLSLALSSVFSPNLASAQEQNPRVRPRPGPQNGPLPGNGGSLEVINQANNQANKIEQLTEFTAPWYRSEQSIDITAPILTNNLVFRLQSGKVHIESVIINGTEPFEIRNTLDKGAPEVTIQLLKPVILRNLQITSEAFVSSSNDKVAILANNLKAVVSPKPAEDLGYEKTFSKEFDVPYTSTGQLIAERNLNLRTRKITITAIEGIAQFRYLSVYTAKSDTEINLLDRPELVESKLFVDKSGRRGKSQIQLKFSEPIYIDELLMDYESYDADESSAKIQIEMAPELAPLDPRFDCGMRRNGESWEETGSSTIEVPISCEFGGSAFSLHRTLLRKKCVKGLETVVSETAGEKIGSRGKCGERPKKKCSLVGGSLINHDELTSILDTTQNFIEDARCEFGGPQSHIFERWNQYRCNDGTLVPTGGVTKGKIKGSSGTACRAPRDCEGGLKHAQFGVRYGQTERQVLCEFGGQESDIYKTEITTRCWDGLISDTGEIKTTDFIKKSESRCQLPKNCSEAQLEHGKFKEEVILDKTQSQIAACGFGNSGKLTKTFAVKKQTTCTNGATSMKEITGDLLQTSECEMSCAEAYVTGSAGLGTQMPPRDIRTGTQEKFVRLLQSKTGTVINVMCKEFYANAFPADQKLTYTCEMLPDGRAMWSGPKRNTNMILTPGGGNNQRPLCTVMESNLRR